MKDKKKYILILILMLIVFYMFNNLIISKSYRFEKEEEYVFIDKKSNEILKDCREAYDNLNKQSDKKDKILSILKVIELNQYLLYKDDINSGIYYDLMKTILSPTEVEKIKDKKKYTNEISSYLNKKRKTKIIYSKYEVSTPIFYNKNDNQYGYVIVKEWSNGKYLSVRYNFIKNDETWYLEDAKIVNIK